MFHSSPHSHRQLGGRLSALRRTLLIKPRSVQALSAVLIVLAVASVGLAQTTIYWTGNGDRWGASPHDKWSQSPGGTDYYQLQGGAEVHMNYDRNVLEGTNIGVLINRKDVVLHSVTMTGDEIGSGFALTLTDNTNNNTGIQLSGPMTVNSGQHSWLRPEVTNPDAAVITLTADSTWTIAEDGALKFGIPLAGGYGVTKEGLGVLAVAGDHTYTGDTVITAGAFGVYGEEASLAGNLSFASGAKLLFDTYTLDEKGDGGLFQKRPPSPFRNRRLRKDSRKA